MKKFFAIACLAMLALVLVIGCGEKKAEPQTEPMTEETPAMEDTTSTMMDSTMVQDSTAVEETMEEAGH